MCRESVAINSSLMTLGRCLETLRWNQQHASQEPRLVPYRESKVGLCTLPVLPLTYHDFVSPACH